MRGVSCGSCEGRRPAKPYVTAYEIAVKQGFRGSEREWINSLQTVHLARVLTAENGVWTCAETLEELLELAAVKEVHLLTKEGRTAFCSRVDNDEIRFRTPTYEAQTHTIYEEYTLTSAGGTYEIVDVDDRDAGSVTKAMLAVEVQNTLDGAIQASAQATKSDNQTQAVGVDANGKLYVANVTDYIPASVQPNKHPGMQNQVGLDENQQLWADGYRKPEGGIPATDLSIGVTKKIELAGISSIGFALANSNYEYVGADFAFSSVDDLIQQIQNGRNLRIVLLGTHDTYPAVHFQGAESLARVYFSGPTVLTGGSYSMTMDAFELAPSGQSISLIKVISKPL